MGVKPGHEKRGSIIPCLKNLEQRNIGNRPTLLPTWLGLDRSILESPVGRMPMQWLRLPGFVQLKELFALTATLQCVRK